MKCKIHKKKLVCLSCVASARGKKGALAQKNKHSHEELSAWGKKGRAAREIDLVAASRS
jgi:hypothetical protein